MNEMFVDKNAEMAVIGSCFLGGSPTLYEVVEILDVEDFYGEQHREIFEKLIEMDKRKEPITDIIAVQTVLGPKYPVGFLVEIVNSVTSYANARHYAEIVKTKAIARKKYQQCHETMNRLADGEEPREVISRSMQNDMAILNSQKKSEVVPARETFHRFLDELEERRKSDGLVGFSTGFADIDNRLRGLRPGGMYIIAARPKMGKTTLALNMVRYMALKLQIPVYLKTLEMTASQVHEKFVSDLADIDGWKLTNPSMLSDYEYKKVTGIGEKLYDSLLFIDERPGRASQFATSLRRWSIENPGGIAVIDYLQRFIPEKGTKGEYEQISEISNIVTNIAKEIPIPIIAISQLSRDVEKRSDKVPMLSDLRGSGALEQDAAAVMMLYRDDYYFPAKYGPNNDPSEVDVYIHANRFGPTGQLKLSFVKAKSRFEPEYQYKKIIGKSIA
jgi:replicative DNA helicase